MIFDIKITKDDIIRASKRTFKKGRYFNGETSTCGYCFFHFLISETCIENRLPCTYL